MNQADTRSVVESRLAPCLVGLAVLFGYMVMSSLLEFGYNAGGDDVVHMAFNHEVEAILEAEGKLFGWSYLFGLGAPIFLFRPPLQYFTVGLLHQATFGLLSLNFIHKLSYVVCLGVYPVTIYFMMRAFRFRPLPSACAGLFAITPISMWGHTIDAYCRLGIAKQLIAITIFPLAMGMIHNAIARNGKILLASLMITLCFLSHPYMPYCLLLMCGIYALSILLITGWKAMLSACARLFLIWSLTGLMLAFYLVPHYSSEEIQMLEFSSSWRHGFEVVCGTTAQTINHFLLGSLFDTTKWGLFGGGEWGWQSNTYTGRWPILTAMCVLGIVLCIIRKREFRCTCLLLSFVMSFLIFLGPDDLFLLDFLPFQGQFQYIHAVFLLDLLAMCLAGLGCAFVIGLGMRTYEKLLPQFADRPLGQFHMFMIGLLLAGVLLYSPYRDRWMVGQRIVQRKHFDTTAREMESASFRLAINTGYKDVLELLRSDPTPGRVYAAPAGKATGQELFYFSILPALCNRTDVICGFFSAEVAGVNKTVIEEFRKEIPLSRNLVELLNVRYLVCARPNDQNLARASEYGKLVLRNAYWSAWRTDGDFSHFDVIRTKPFLVLAGIAEWRQLCHRWLDAYMITGDTQDFPYLVYAGADSRKLLEWDSARFSGVILLGGNHAKTGAVRTRLASLQRDGHLIISQHGLDGIQVERIRYIDEIDFEALSRSPSPDQQCAETASEREHHAARVALNTPAFVVFKNAFYRSWIPRLNGETVDNIEISPGYSSLYVPAGDHEITFDYEGPNNFSIGATVTLVALVAALGLTIVGSPRLGRRVSLPTWLQGNIEVSRSPHAIRAGVTACLILVTLFLLTRYVREQFFHIPVPTRPAAYSESGARITLDWNKLDLTNALYDVQVTDSGRSFDRIIFEKTGISQPHARKEFGLLPGSKYWWRIRSNVDGRYSPWSIGIPFRTADDTAHAADAGSPYRISVTHDPLDPEGIRIKGKTNLPNGTYLHSKLYDKAKVKGYQSTGMRVKHGRFDGVLRPPKSGWPTNISLTASIDCALTRQRYPITELLHPHGLSFVRRGIAENHQQLHGVAASLDVGAYAPGEVWAQPAENGEGAWKVVLQARYASPNELEILGHTSFPNHSRFLVTLTRARGVDSFLNKMVDVRDGKFYFKTPLDEDGALRVAAYFEPDRQYESIRRQFGLTGDAIKTYGTPDANRLYGLRAEINLGVNPWDGTSEP